MWLAVVRIIFDDDSLQEVCEKAAVAKRRLGADGARKLQARLADLAAAASAKDLVAGRPHALKGERKGQIALDLDGGRRLVFVPEDGGVARIVYIGDYHD